MLLFFFVFVELLVSFWVLRVWILRSVETRSLNSSWFGLRLNPVRPTPHAFEVGRMTCSSTGGKVVQEGPVESCTTIYSTPSTEDSSNSVRKHNRVEGAGIGGRTQPLRDFLAVAVAFRTRCLGIFFKNDRMIRPGDGWPRSCRRIVQRVRTIEASVVRMEHGEYR